MCLFSMSVLQIRSSISFFSYIPHVCVNIWYLFFSFWLHSVWQSLCPSTSLQRTQFHPFLLLRNIPLYICTTSSFSTPLSRHLSCFRVLALVNSAGLGCMCLFEVCFSLVYDQSWDWWVGKRICLQCSRCRRQGLNPCQESPRTRAWQPTPVFLPGESHGQRSLAGYSLHGHKELDMTEVTEHTAHGSSMFNFLWFNIWFWGKRNMQSTEESV